MKVGRSRNSLPRFLEAVPLALQERHGIKKEVVGPDFVTHEGEPALDAERAGRRFGSKLRRRAMGAFFR